MTAGEWFATIVSSLFAWVVWTVIAGNMLVATWRWGRTALRIAAPTAGALITATIIAAVMGLGGAW